MAIRASRSLTEHVIHILNSSKLRADILKLVMPRIMPSESLPRLPDKRAVFTIMLEALNMFFHVSPNIGLIFVSLSADFTFPVSDSMVVNDKVHGLVNKSVQS